jgi:hypothetical protein
MKFKLTGAMLLSCFLLQAQPVIDRSNYFEIGDSVLVYHKADTSLNSFTPGPSGANVLWDFSAMDFQHPSITTDTLFYISSVGTYFYPSSMSADYSLSNMCVLRKAAPFDPFNNDFNYFISDNDSISFIGHWANNGGTSLWEDHCTNVIKEIAFPFTYANAYVDPYVRFFYDMSGSDGHYLTGTNTVTADGYGTLITPGNVTVNNVLRIHSIETVRDSNYMFGITTYATHTYRWYSSDVKGVIFSMQMIQNNPAVIQSANYIEQMNFNTGVNNAAANSAFHISPNPSEGRFYISSVNNKEINRVEIFNSTGQKISAINSILRNGYEIDLSEYGSGIYFIGIHSGAQVHFEKLVVY